MTRTAPRAAQSGPPRLRAYPGLDRVLRDVADLIAAWRNDSRVRSAALAMAVGGGQKLNARTQHADMRDFEGVAAAVYRAVVRQTVYTRDPYRSELVQAPLDTLARGMGDCDDLVVLGGSLLAAVGVPVRVVAVGYTPAAPGTRPTRTDDGGPYEHVYLEFDPTGAGLWQAWDATLETRSGDVSPGIVLRRKVVDPVGAGSFGLADAKVELVKLSDLGTARTQDDGTRTPVTVVTPPPPPTITLPPTRIKGAPLGLGLYAPTLLSASQQAALTRAFRQTAQTAGFDLSQELGEHFARAGSVQAAQARFNTWFRERIAARTLAERTYGGTPPGETPRGSTTPRDDSAGGGSAGGGSAGGGTTPGGPSKVFLLAAVAGVAALVFGGGLGGPKPSGKTIRTVKTTDEKFG